MYELVNTSLPNGLLPGTHGFATVAMTRGTPDQVRLALESLSSYRHRCSEHDARYATDNPVAWNHLLLRDGSHVVSCVHASNFDYTGRTNRLARHWCLTRAEFPDSVNPADFLAANLESLFSSWEGLPRWIEPRGDNPFGSLVPRSDLRSVAWISLYGEERGTFLAACFASLLRSEIGGGNRPIVFRTSQTWDPNGRKLLALFADLIALLPPELRSKASFSTYPAALRSHFVCHLRGLQPDSPDLPILTAGRPWLDCEAGTVGNEAKLPHDPALEKLARYGHATHVVPPLPEAGKPHGPSGAMATEEGGVRAAFEAGHMSATPRRASGKAPNGISCPFPESSLLPPPRRDNTTLYAVTGGVAVAIAMTVAVFVLKGERTPLRRLSNSSEAGGLVPTNGLQVESSQEFRQKEEAPLLESTPKPEQHRVPPSDRTAESAVSLPKVSKAAEQSPEPSQEPEWAFASATNLMSGVRPFANNDGKSTWFFYDGSGKLVSADATPKKTPGGGWRWINDPSKPKSGASTGPDRFILLYLHDRKALHVEFPKDWRKVFNDKDELNLREFCFGSESAVFDAWCRLNGRTTQSDKVQYEIAYATRESIGTKEIPKSFRTDDDPLELGAVVNAIHKTEIKDLKGAVEKAENDLKTLRSKLEEIERNLTAASNLNTRVSQNLAEKDPKKKDSELKKIVEEYRKLFPEKHSENSDPTAIRGVMADYEKKREDAKSELGAAQSKRDAAQSDWDKFDKEQSNREKMAREMFFMVSPIPVKKGDGQ